MQPVFLSYPTHPWLSEWIFEARGCGTIFRDKNAGYFFQSTDIVGRIAPLRESPEWALQVPIPQNSQINMLHNGFCGFINRRKQSLFAETTVPEPGVVWGRYSGIPAPVLITKETVADINGYHWLESDTQPALLAVRDGVFCLVSKLRIFDDAVRLAESYLAENIEIHLRGELDRRAGAAKLFENMSHHDSLGAISAESLMRALRPPEGNISGWWSQSPATESPCFDINELYTLALSWRQLDIGVAEDLVRSVLNLQASSGAIPVTYSPHQTFSILEAPRPLIAKAAEKVWQVRKDPKFLADIIPPLRRHLQWLLHHFDPKRRGLHCWQSSGEMFNPEAYSSDLATADLAVLLLTEIGALNQLRQASLVYKGLAPYFEEEREALEHNLQTQFWNAEEGQFCNAIIRGRMAKLQGFSTFVPLLWEKLPQQQKSIVLDGIRKSGILPGGKNVLTWHSSALENNPVPLSQQHLILETLKTADPQGSLLSDFARISLQSFVEWHSLSLEAHSTVNIDPVTAAYILALQETHTYRYHAKGGITGFVFNVLRKTRADRFDLAVILLTLLALFSVNTFYDILHRPPPLVTLETRMNSAYARKDVPETINACTAIIKHYPDQASLAKLYAGNILLMDKQFEQAAGLFADIRVEYPDSPGPMISLGLAYQLQGKFKEADANFAEFTYLFDEIFPEVTAKVERYRNLIQEGLRVPPNWPEIYRYQLMHEL